MMIKNYILNYILNSQYILFLSFFKNLLLYLISFLEFENLFQNHMKSTWIKVKTLVVFILLYNGYKLLFVIDQYTTRVQTPKLPYGGLLFSPTADSVCVLCVCVCLCMCVAYVVHRDSP